VIQQEAAGTEEVVQFFEVLHHAAATNVFEHPDRCHLVDSTLDFPVVTQQNPDTVGQLPLRNHLTSKIELLFAQRAADRGGTIFFGGMQRERTPSAPNVEERLAALNIQLSANVLNFAELRFVQTLIWTLKVTARIDHSRIEELRVELVGLVVMKPNVRSGAMAALKPRLEASHAVVCQGTVEQVSDPAMRLTPIMTDGGYEVAFDAEFPAHKREGDGIWIVLK
jgi:hypothetical protein